MFPRHRGFVLSAAVAVAALFATGLAYAADRLPFKMFDAHAHFISDDTARYPLTGQTVQGAQPPTGSGATGSAQPGASPSSPPPGGSLLTRYRNGFPNMERILAWWDANGVEGGVGVQYQNAYGTNNTYLLDTADQHPDRIAPVVILKADDPKTPDLLRSLVKARGVAGIRLTGPADDTGWLDSAAALKTWEVANDLGISVVVMFRPAAPTSLGAIASSPSALARIGELAQKFPNTKIVLDHIGFPAVEGAPDYGVIPAHAALKAYKNIYYKFTTINLDRLAERKISSSDFLRHVVDVFGADHMMWGSDIGNSSGTYEEMVARAIEAAAKLSPAEQRQLFRETGRSVFLRGGRGAQSSTQSSAAAMPTPPKAARGPALDVALKMAREAISVCQEAGLQVGVSVVDSAGAAIVTLVADGSTARAITTVRKAGTAMTFQMPTSELEERMKTDQALAARVAANPEFVAHPGALPLRVGDEVIGGIGVSGAPNHEAGEACAMLALEKFKMQLK